MAQQRAVEYIENNLIKVEEGWQYLVLGGEEYINTKHIKTLFEQAKQMEKEQMEQCYKEGIEDTKKVLKDELKDLLVFPNPYKK